MAAAPPTLPSKWMNSRHDLLMSDPLNEMVVKSVCGHTGAVRGTLVK
jgi:hypothetical protein